MAPREPASFQLGWAAAAAWAFLGGRLPLARGVEKMWRPVVGRLFRRLESDAQPCGIGPPVDYGNSPTRVGMGIYMITD